MPDQLLTSQSCHSLADWLCYIEQSHPVEKIELGLQRVQQVAARGKLAELPGRIILIAGTNGKGTTARALEQLLLAQGYQVGVYSSPHILAFNERLRLNGQNLPDQEWLDAFAAVEQLRETIALTYFEFTTLVAFAILRQHKPDFCLIEVGLGGRLDATNIVTPDLSIITTVDLDHQAFLGNDRESIGREKAGIFRAAIPVISGDPQLPSTVLDAAALLGSPLWQLQRDFHYSVTPAGWNWYGRQQQRLDLPLPAVPLPNVAVALAALEQLACLPAAELIQQVLSDLSLPGRMQLINRSPTVLLDVAHNPQSTTYLAGQLPRLSQGCRRRLALVGMLKDKDLLAALTPLTSSIDEWHLVSLPGSRGATSEQLSMVLRQLVPDAKIKEHSELASAYLLLRNRLAVDEFLVVFGSFVTVAGVLALSQETS